MASSNILSIVKSTYNKQLPFYCLINVTGAEDRLTMVSSRVASKNIAY